MRNYLLISASLLALTACDLSPDFKLPEILTPASFKEDVSVEAVSVEPATDGKWKRTDDKAQIEEFAWWRMFKDAKLDNLMERALKDNPSLEAAMQRVNSARALADNRNADLYPAISAGIGPERQRQSPASQEANMPPGSGAPVTKPYTLYSAKGTITYELDLFGRNRNRAKAAEFDADAEANNYRASRLSLQTEIAQTYYRLAALRAEEKLLNRTTAARVEALKLMRSRFDAGMIDALTISSSETDLAAVKVDAAAVAQNRAVAEHALAVLVGVPPSELNVETAQLKSPPPTVPAGIPSSLLERRPDIHRAVSNIAAANARIGVARTGYFPDISLSAMGGFVSGDLDDLFKWSNRTWLIGPLAGTMLTQPIFEGGRLAAAKAQSEAEYGVAVADYRTAVLTAFREVEDQLSGLRYTSEQAKAAKAGAAASTRALKAADERYKTGYSSHIEFLDAERNALAAQRTEVQVRGNQYVTTIQLVKALGGSWQAPSKPESIAPAPAPVVEKPAPVVETPAPVLEAPKAEAPAEQAPAPVEQKSTQEAPAVEAPVTLPAQDPVQENQVQAPAVEPEPTAIGESLPPAELPSAQTSDEQPTSDGKSLLDFDVNFDWVPSLESLTPSF